MAGFRYVGNLLGGAAVAPPKDNAPFQMTDAEAGAEGSIQKFATNTEQLTLCAGVNVPAVLLLETVAAATPGNLVRGMWLMPGMIFEAPVTAKNGSSTYTAHANFVVGFTGIQINDLGTGIDAVTAPANGKLILLEYDATNKRAKVAISATLLSNYIANS